MLQRVKFNILTSFQRSVSTISHRYVYVSIVSNVVFLKPPFCHELYFWSALSQNGSWGVQSRFLYIWFKPRLVPVTSQRLTWRDPHYSIRNYAGS